VKFGLKDADIGSILSIVSKFPAVTEVILFGSRALGTHKPGSDIDLALKGNLTVDIIAKIHYELNEESPLPYFFDVLDYQTLQNPELKAHIDRVGIRL